LPADNKPIAVELEAGKTYFFCACGKSSNQPFCDGAHKGSGMAPQAFKAEKDGMAYLCQCKQSGNQPFCDGTHKGIAAEQVGEPLAD
jgi:CDGSH-type Zn-finger protein